MHESDRHFEETGYLVRRLMAQWSEAGHRVTVVRDPRAALAADLIFPHLDLTVTPEPVRELLASHPRVVNRRLTDISKSRVSTNLVRRGDGWHGPVIVKTDRNFGGQPERRLGLAPARPSQPLPPAATPARDRERIWRSTWGRLVRKTAGVARRMTGRGTVLDGSAPVSSAPAIDWARVETLDTGSYPVFENMGAVPAGVFVNPNLVVERFLPERDGDHYCLHYYYICGDREASVRLKSSASVVKGSSAIAGAIEPPPDVLRELCQSRGIGYGKLDYVMHDGQVVLLDINRTPATSSLVRWQLDSQVVDALAPGLPALVAAAG